MKDDLEILDWSKTQNEAYISLSEKRLSEPRLIWVNQFISIINELIEGGELNLPKKISINDYGCNVGHFFRGIEDIKCSVDYKGFDISQTYLSIAKKKFKSQNFNYLDISLPSNSTVLKSNVSVISATLEHIEDYESAILNIFTHTGDLVLIRTFIGDVSLSDKCRTVGASSDYLIRQFTVDQLIDIPSELGWFHRQELDMATGGESKMVCNSSSILRKQKVFVFSRQSISFTNAVNRSKTGTGKA
jgi:hypothetical protein